ncbi:MAG: ParB/RepB/Spo0J family partition protein [Gemmatimonadota bacterium]
MTEARRLGRGLEALLGPVNREKAESSGQLQELLVGSISPNPYQPRTSIDEPSFRELVASLEVSGLLQPILVRPHEGGYELIAGERRWRAAQQLGWSKIPAVIKEADDRTLLTLALVENLQRDNLSAIEEAISYQKLVDEFQVSQGEIARFVGRDRSTISNALRLLKLPPDVRAMVDDGRLTEGHARALLALSDPQQMHRMAQNVIAGGWSVRDLESRIRSGAPGRKAAAPKVAVSPVQKRIEEALRKRLGTDATVVTRRRGRGVLTLNFYSNEDLARLLEIILGEPFEG